MDFKHRRWWGAVVVIAGLLGAPLVSEGQVGGNLAAGPPVELALEISTRGEGPALSTGEYALVTGEYYRLTITSDGVRTWRFEAAELLQNAHLRIVTINEVEVHLQSLSFRAIEFDVAGSAQFSFTPVRTGTYEFSVGLTPSARRENGGDGLVRRGRFVVE